jgi:phosphoribosylanthranilate isomerase
MTTRVKICCISSIDEAKMAIKFGASALGLVVNMSLPKIGGLKVNQ